MNSQNIDVLLQRTAELENELASKTRELQIEAALDRVRTRAMAMKHSDELKNLIATVSGELARLDFVLDRSFIIIFDPETKGMTWWMANPETPTEPMGLFIQYHEQPPFLAYLKAWEERDLQWQYVLEGEVKRTWDKFLFSETGLSQLPGDIAQNMQSKTKVYLSASFNNFGALTIATLTPLSQPQFDVLLRFANVFDQTYTRFLDLQKAEAQAREAQIEASVERIRSKALAMYKSEDLLEVVLCLRQELVSLDIGGLTAATILLQQNNGHIRLLDITVANIAEDAIRSSWDFEFQLEETDNRVYYKRVWNQTAPYFIVEQDEHEIWAFIHWLENFRKEDAEEIMLAVKKYNIRHTWHPGVGLEKGKLCIDLMEPPATEIENILVKIGNAFDLAYRRFIDLQNAEARAKEAQIEAALERVRARTMAMQHSKELSETSLLLVQQVKALNIDVWGCAFNIFDEEEKSSTEWFSNDDGSQPTYKLPREGVFLKYYDAAQRGETLHVEEFAGEKCTTHYEYLKTLPVLGDVLKHYSEAGIAIPAYQIDHLAFFKQGYLLFITQKPVPEAHDIFKRFANVFEQTYTRFLDLQKAEAQAIKAEQDLIEIKAARQKAEETLATLKATQQQLIQKEKMASLGELTAGIAHEIQNPLNFVNNFAEANKELIEELEQANEKGDHTEVKVIAADLKANEEKIFYHGRRADNIVKGMLQHARASSGEKQSTDINLLVEEHLKLAYHGYRAKDQSFHTDLCTDYDSNVGQLNVVPQEIGRVLLNLFSNAFYAVYKKKKQFSDTFEPSVHVCTKHESSQILIAVTDNGVGMPPNVAEKVFQPFFTTKPTGEGTGLGLSLSYDIITKGHGGNLSVTSTEGEGSEFVVQLPV
jgi:signal transduction histidine kinase